MSRVDGRDAPISDRIIGREKGLTLLAVLIAAALVGFSALAQETMPIKGDRLSGVVLPVEPIEGDIRINALRAYAWEIDDTKRLLLERDVTITIGSFSFSSDKAVVWINRIPSADGLINQIAIYFDEVHDSGRRAGLGASGVKLLVTGSARGEVILKVALLDEQRPGGRAIVHRAEDRLAAYLKQVLGGRPPLERHPQIDAEPPAEMPELVPGGAPPEELPPLATQIELPGEGAALPLFSPTGRITLNARRVEVRSGDEENVIIASDSLVVEYIDERANADFSRLTLSAQRGVVFTKPGPLDTLPGLTLDADFVRGIYLEGNVVASDGQYTIRGSRVYYDVEHNQALILDGILRTYSRDIGRTVYARAQEIRQIAQRQWRAKKAIVSTSEFFTPHLAVGARTVTITERPSGAGGRVTHVESTDNTMRIGGTPVFWWPRLSGTARDMPLTGVRTGHNENDGAFVETTWDAFTLFGREAPPGIDLKLRFDVFSKRAVAGGVLLDYDDRQRRMKGTLDLYAMKDTGTDRTSTGREVEQDNVLRGVALWEHQMRFNERYTLQTQISFISDETFITTWREDDFAERREYENSIYLRHLNKNTAWTALIKTDIDDFISNSSLLASRQYQVEKLPEFTFRRYGDSLFDDRVTYSSEYRVSNMRLSFEENSPRELGVRAGGFGIGRDDTFGDELRALGLDETSVGRFDTRHELSFPGTLGPFDVTPFVVGRITAYSDDFAEFSSDADSTRFFGALGLRASTTLQHIDNSVDSRMFDLHRLRHLVEPNLTLWYGYSTVDQSDLPVFDEEVESLADAAAVRFGLLQTWQTQRGGPGRWHSVDWITVDLGLVLASSEVEPDHPVPQFFEYRPELSVLGNFGSARATWLLSDALTFAGEAIYDFDETRVARGAIGVELRHSPIFSTFVEFRYIDASDSELLGVSWSYQLTPKYAVVIRPQYDFRQDDLRSIRLTLTRSFPDFDFRLRASRDDIKGETTVSASIRVAEF